MLLALAVLLTVTGLMVSDLTGTAHARADAQKDEPKTRVTVFLLPAPGFSDRVVARVSNHLRTALRKNKRLMVKDWNKLLVEFSGEAPTEAVAKGRAMRDEGIQALDGGDAAAAIEKLTGAMTQLESVLAFVKKRDLAEAQLALGVAYARNKQRRQAHNTFVALLTWRPTIRFDTGRFGTKLLGLFARARASLKRAKRGSVELTTEPAGAKAYVDGRFVGVTPTSAFGLPVGPHYATFKKPGFIKAAQRVVVSPLEQRTFNQALKRSEKFLLMQQTLKRASTHLGKAEASAAMLDLRSVLFVDQVVFATMGYHSQGQLKLQTYLYDLRSKLRLNTTSMVISEKKLTRLDELARLLYLNIRYDGTIEEPPPPPPPPPEKRRAFYATWWFWSAIGAGAAAITLTTVFWPTDDSCQGNVAGAVRCVSGRN